MLSRCFLVIFGWLVAGWLAPAQGQYFDCEELLFPRPGPDKRLGYVNMVGEWRVNAVFWEARPFEGRFAVVKKDKRYGVINCEGILVVPAEYEEIGPFAQSIGWALKNGQWGLVRSDGRTVMPHSFAEVRELSPQGMLTWVRDDRGWGLISKETYRPVAEPQFQSVQPLSDSASLVRVGNAYGLFSHRLARLVLPTELQEVFPLTTQLFSYQQNDRWGAFDRRGNLVLPADYDTLARRGTRVLLVREGKAGLADGTGQVVISPTFEEIEDFSNGLAKARHNGKYGYLTAKGQVVIPFEYEAGQAYRDGRLIVRQGGHYGLINPRQQTVVPFGYTAIERHAQRPVYIACRDTNCQLLDTAGQALTRETFRQIMADDTATHVRVVRGTRWGFYDLDRRQWASDLRFDSATALTGGYAQVRSGQQWGVMNAAGALVIPTRYDYVRPLRLPARTLFLVDEATGLGLTDDQHRLLLPTIFEVIRLADGYVLKARREGRWGLYQTSGEEVLAPTYDVLDTLASWPAVMGRKGRYGLLAADGREVLRPTYDTLQALGQGFFAARRKQSWQVLNPKGETIPTATYDTFRPFVHGRAAVARGDKWGFVDERFREVIAPQYDEVLDFAPTATYVRQGNRWGAIGISGEELLPLEYSGHRRTAEGTRRLYR